LGTWRKAKPKACQPHPKAEKPGCYMVFPSVAALAGELDILARQGTNRRIAHGTPWRHYDKHCQTVLQKKAKTRSIAPG
jgi:hypothetical protein